MPTGHTSALAKAGHTPYAVLEVDEHYLAQVLAATNPRVVALLNLSRDQLDRAKEVAMMAQLWRDALAEHPRRARGGQRRRPDGGLGGAAAQPIGDLGQRRPALARRLLGLPGVRRRTIARGARATQWWLHRLPAAPARATVDASTDSVVDPTGARHKVTLQLPGRVNLANAATALAVAAQFGVRPTDALPRLAGVASIAGRYAQVVRDGRNIRLLLAKNPAAGWRRSTWPTRRRHCCPSTPATPTAWTPPGCSMWTSRRCAAGRC